MKYKKIKQEAEKWVKTYFETRFNSSLVYHNNYHTFQVVEAATLISNHYQLEQEEAFIVNIAAWFHDTGYLESPESAQHEERSVVLAEAFLQKYEVDAAIIEQVKNCIIATQIPQKPQNLLEQIVCDADLFHLGSDEFKGRNKLMRKEMEAVSGQEVSKKDWKESTITLFENHHYHTDFAQLLLNNEKQKNLDNLKKDSRKVIQYQPVTLPESETMIPLEKPKKAEKTEKESLPSRGIETMFRITSGNNQKLSDMADNKAQILITVNSIILSVVISSLFKELEESNYLNYPTFGLLMISVATIVISILATRPKIPEGKFTEDDLETKKVNLLFFGNFYNNSLEEYTNGMKKVMVDKEFLYETLIKDVYFQGVILGKKYHLLRLAYNVFMFGLIICVLGFIVASLINK
jgi:predicted metal-dependent HD superfamily phosphohydrolase